MGTKSTAIATPARASRRIAPQAVAGHKAIVPAERPGRPASRGPRRRRAEGRNIAAGATIRAGAEARSDLLVPGAIAADLVAGAARAAVVSPVAASRERGPKDDRAELFEARRPLGEECADSLDEIRGGTARTKARGLGVKLFRKRSRQRTVNQALSIA